MSDSRWILLFFVHMLSTRLFLNLSISSRSVVFFLFFFFNDTATTEIYTLSLHDALPICVNQNYFTESSVIVARVDGHEIKQADWENAHRMESDRLRAENPNIDPKLLDSPQARYATLEKMVRDQVLAAAVQKMHLAASDAQLVRTLQEIPAIAALKKPDGSMDAEAYRALVGSRSEEHTSELQSPCN